MYFLGQSDKARAMHHIKYSALLAVGALVLFFVLNGFFANVVNIAYVAGSAFLAWKAYNGEEVNIEILDAVEGKISEKVKR